MEKINYTSDDLLNKAKEYQDEEKFGWMEICLKMAIELEESEKLPQRQGKGRMSHLLVARTNTSKV